MRFLGVSSKRFLVLVPQLVVISFLTFAFMRALPGNPALQLVGPAATEQAIAEVEHRLGLDLPFWEQYTRYVGKVVRGDLGRSILSGDAVVRDLLTRTPATLELITISLIIVVVIALPLGIYLAQPGRRRIDRVVTRGTSAYGLLAGSLPDFWLGLVLVYVLFFKAGVAPAPLGRISPDVTPPDQVTGFLLIDSMLGANWGALRSSVSHLLLPVLTLVFVYVPVVLKMARSTIFEVLDAPYMRFAGTCGVPRRKMLQAAARNTVGPVVTVIALVYGYLLGGAVLVETVFSWGGVGQYAAQAIIQADFEAIQGFVLLAVVFNLLVYLAADLIHAAADPRVRL